jgi:hypothetical protein
MCLLLPATLPYTITWDEMYPIDVLLLPFHICKIQCSCMVYRESRHLAFPDSSSCHSGISFILWQPISPQRLHMLKVDEVGTTNWYVINSNNCNCLCFLCDKKWYVPDFGTIFFCIQWFFIPTGACPCLLS